MSKFIFFKIQKVTFIQLFTVLIISLLYSSCAYNKIKKGEDSAEKYRLGVELYGQEKYGKAIPLLEDIIPVYKGTTKGEEVFYKYAYCNYQLRDYILAGYYFRKFAETYPIGQFTEDARYMSAYCYYLDAPKPSLDQETTMNALQEFRFFISKYPNSEKIPECNSLVNDLRDRLETKSFNNAHLYYDLEYYKSAVIALKNSKLDYPDTDYKEEIYYTIMSAYFLYAKNSIEEKQKERYTDAINAQKDFVQRFPDSKYIKDAEKILKESKEHI